MSEESWYGHKFKKINDTTWKCECGEEIHTCIPKGYVLVPVEPTPEMLDAGIAPKGYAQDGYPNGYTLKDEYKAMIAAAQESEE